ncbi:hypothetical protein DFH06DRAFT_1227534 [Mycena polygramma]|nr:hypothetical protein DFH06DRAFT_1227534 [Mycena polygramma]
MLVLILLSFLDVNNVGICFPLSPHGVQARHSLCQGFVLRLFSDVNSSKSFCAARLISTCPEKHLTPSSTGGFARRDVELPQPRQEHPGIFCRTQSICLDPIHARAARLRRLSQRQSTNSSEIIRLVNVGA